MLYGCWLAASKKISDDQHQISGLGGGFFVSAPIPHFALANTSWPSQEPPIRFVLSVMNSVLMLGKYLGTTIRTTHRQIERSGAEGWLDWNDDDPGANAKLNM